MRASLFNAFLTIVLLTTISTFTQAQSIYEIIDTGQTTCYDNSLAIICPEPGATFFGQDASYSGTQSAYLDNGDGTVTDLDTGLMWQQGLSEKMIFADAVTGADTLSLASYTDWRLPSIKELYSLILFSGIDPSGWEGTDSSELTPFIDTEYFEFAYGDVNAGERIIDAQYWSSTEYVSTTMHGDATAFGVNFADGRIKGYPSEPVGPPGQQHTMHSFVRYVRCNSTYGVNNLVDNSDGTVTDLATGLMWQQADDGVARLWETALDHAENLGLAGYDNWRLPDAKELQSIVDYTRSPSTHGTAAIDPLFSCTAISDEAGEANFPFYWTGTTHVNWTPDHYGESAVYVAFGEALGWMQPPNGGDYELLDVHGAGAQRSDPKVGDPADWPYGNGPQGDVIRILNYVRCVRTAAAETPPSPTGCIIQIEENMVYLQWEAVPGASGYRVYSASSPYTDFSEDLSGSFTANSWQAPLPEESRYYYVTTLSGE